MDETPCARSAQLDDGLDFSTSALQHFSTSACNTFRQRLKSLGFETLECRRLLASLPAIVDNTSPNFSTEGDWSTYQGLGYEGDFLYSTAPYDGNDTATWRFDLEPGNYRIAASWKGDSFDYGSQVPITLYDGDVIIVTAQLNQNFASNDFFDGGAWWEELGVFAVGSSLTITMSDNTNGIPIADAMRVERVDNLPYASVVDNASSSFSTTGVWTNYGPNAGYAGTFRYATAPYNSNDTATWAFDISPGTYRIAATWPGNSNTWGSNIPLSIYDGQRYVGGATLNQHLPPNDFISQSTPWENVGVFTILDSLRIVMSNKADGIPIADAFRVERVSAESVPVANDDRSYSTPAAPMWPDAPPSAPLPSALPAAASITRLGYNSTGDVTFHQAADGGMLRAELRSHF